MKTSKQLQDIILSVFSDSPSGTSISAHDLRRALKKRKATVSVVSLQMFMARMEERGLVLREFKPVRVKDQMMPQNHYRLAEEPTVPPDQMEMD
jgi:hypothetical protein